MNRRFSRTVQRLAQIRFFDSSAKNPDSNDFVLSLDHAPGPDRHPSPSVRHNARIRFLWQWCCSSP